MVTVGQWGRERGVGGGTEPVEYPVAAASSECLDLLRTCTYSGRKPVAPPTALR